MADKGLKKMSKIGLTCQLYGGKLKIRCLKQS